MASQSASSFLQQFAKKENSIPATVVPSTMSANSFLTQFKPLDKDNSSVQESGPIVSPSGLVERLKPRPEDIPELVATTLTGMKTAGLKSPLGIAATGLAGGIGNIAEQYREAIYDPAKAPKTSGEALKRAGGGVLMGVLGDTIGRAGGKLLKPFSGSVTPELEIARKVAEKEGIEAPVSNLVNNRSVQMAERSLEFSPFGGAITKQKTKALEQFKDFTGRVGENIGADTDPAITGALLKEQTAAYKEAYDQAKDKLYDAVMPQVSKLPADVTETLATLKSIVERRSGVAQPAGLKEINGWIKQIESGAIKTFADLRKFRTNVGARGKFNDPALSGLSADMSNLYASISQGLDKTAAAAGEEIATALKQADEFYAMGKNTLKSKVYKALVNAPQDRMHAIAFNPKSPTQYDLVKEIVGKESMKDISGQWYGEMIKKNAKHNAGIPSPKKLLTDLEAYSGTLQKVAEDFPEVGEKLTELKQVAQLLSTGKEVAQGSQTAPAGVGLGVIYMNLAYSLQRLLSGDLKGAGIATATAGGATLASGLGVGAIKSKAGREFLTRGFPKASKAATRLIQPTAQIGLKGYMRDDQ